MLDPWNEFEHVRPREITQTEYTGMAIRAIKRFAKKHRVHVIVVAHPAKMTRGKDGKYPQPTLYDIADSAHWANKPDVGVLIWREGPEPGLPTKIVVAKSRYHSEIGRPGAIMEMLVIFCASSVRLVQGCRPDDGVAGATVCRRAAMARVLPSSSSAPGFLDAPCRSMRGALSRAGSGTLGNGLPARSADQ